MNWLRRFARRLLDRCAFFAHDTFCSCDACVRCVARATGVSADFVRLYLRSLEESR